MDSLLRSFFEHAEAEPQRLVAVGPDLAITRGELAGEVHQAADRLAAGDLAPGTVVAVVAGAAPAFLGAWLTCREAELCPLLIDSGVPLAEQRRIARRLGAALIWRTAEVLDAAALDGQIENIGAGRQLPRVASLRLTSGSTGKPVGIAVPETALLEDGRALATSIGITPDDRIFATLPMSHAYGFSVLACPVFLLGATLVFPRGEAFVEAAARYRATVFPSVPAWYRAQLGLAQRGPLCDGTRVFMSAGSPLPPETAKTWREIFGRPIHVLYGSSECGGITYDQGGDAAERGTVGTPITGVQIEIMTGEGEPHGLVAVESRAVARGYLPEDLDGCGRLGHGRFLSEDLGSFEEGELVLHGRRSDWIDIKGRNVNPREVERILAGLPGIAETTVFGRPLPGGKGECLEAVVACEGKDLKYRDVVAWCRLHLASHKVPRRIVIVRELPRTERGKLDREALLAL